jgi:hypothetical protein
MMESLPLLFSEIPTQGYKVGSGVLVVSTDSVARSGNEITKIVRLY